MPKRNQKQRHKQKERRRLRRSERRTLSAHFQHLPQETEDMGSDTNEVQQDNKPTMLIHSVKALAILPLAFLVIFLSVETSIPGLSPNWFKPVTDHIAPILTITAVNLAVIGLLMNNRGLLGWRMLAVVLSQIAVHTAAFEGLIISIGEQKTDTAVIVIVTIQYPLVVVALSADWISAMLLRIAKWAHDILIWAWNFARSRSGIQFSLFMLTIVSYYVAQREIENYQSYFLLLLTRILALAGILFGLFLLIKFLPTAYKCVKKLVSKFWIRLKKLSE